MSPSIRTCRNVTSVCSCYVATRLDSWENSLQQLVRYFPVYNRTAQLCKLSRLFVIGRLTNLTYPVSWGKMKPRTLHFPWRTVTNRAVFHIWMPKLCSWHHQLVPKLLAVDAEGYFSRKQQKIIELFKDHD